MKKYIALAVIGFAVSANAQTVNFTNSCNYKISLQALNVINLLPVPDESGDYEGHGIISFTLPAAITSNVPGIVLRPIDVAFNGNCSVYISNSLIQAKAGSNDVVKLNKVVRDLGRALGADLKAQLAQ